MARFFCHPGAHILGAQRSVSVLPKTSRTEKEEVRKTHDEYRTYEMVLHLETGAN